MALLFLLWVRAPVLMAAVRKWRPDFGPLFVVVIAYLLPALFVPPLMDQGAALLRPWWAFYLAG